MNNSSEKILSIHEILRNILNLSQKDLEIVDIFLNSHFDELCVKEISSFQDIPERTLQRRLKNLVEKGLINRRTIQINEFMEICDRNDQHKNFTEDMKGYLYVYRLIPKGKLRKRFEQILNIWK